MANEDKPEEDHLTGQFLTAQLAVKCKKCKTPFALGVVLVEPDKLNSRKAEFNNQPFECPACHDVATYDFDAIVAKELKG